MVSTERMKQIEAYVAFWESALARSKEQLAHLLLMKDMTLSVIDQTGRQYLDDRIIQEGSAINEYNKGLIKAQQQLSQARNGQNV